jgi:hypothetical protein
VKIRRAKRPPLTEEEIRQRVLNPPKQTLAEKLVCVIYRLDAWKCRHITQRDLHRRLDRARLQFTPPELTPEEKAALERLLKDGGYPDVYPW